MGKQIIQLNNVCKGYGNRHQRYVLDHLNLTLEEGEMTAIVGKSGSGKTTLLNILGLNLGMDEGEYFLDHESVNGKKDEELAKLRNEKIGYVLQDFKLISKLSVQENIAVPLLVRGDREEDCQEMIEDLAIQMGIGDLLERKVKELSGGEKQRVAIARALIGNPRIILADEPTGALDTQTTDEILEILKALNEQGKTILIVTHDHKVADYCDRTVQLVKGKLQN